MGDRKPTASEWICHRLVVMGELVVSRPLHVGSGQAGPHTDAAIRRDRSGHPYLPGSTLAGLLRATAEDFAPYLCGDPDTTLRALFGRVRGDDSSRGWAASRLSVEDAPLVGELPNTIEVRDHVGIDRRRGVARRHLKFDHEIAPENTRYQAELALQAGEGRPSPERDEVRLLLAALDFWAARGVRIGAKTTTGLGQAKLEKLEYRALNFGSRPVLEAFLKGTDTPANQPFLDATKSGRAELDRWVGAGPPNVATRLSEGRDAFLPQYLTVTLDLHVEEPLLIKGGLPKIAADDRPNRASDAESLTTPTRCEPGAVGEVYGIPGSSLRGVLRTRAEKIVRTLNYHRDHGVEASEADPTSMESAYRDRIAACAPTHDDGEPLARLESCGSKRRQRKARRAKADAIFDGSCPICRVFGNTLMRGRLACGEARPTMDLKPKLFDHVAIDRFTGGAADEKKFDARPLVPLDPNQQHFSVTLRLERFELWMLGLVAYLLKDLRVGDLRLGHGIRRGCGRIRGFVRHATLLVLPGTELAARCRESCLPLAPPAGMPYGPHRLVDLDRDWGRLFGRSDEAYTSPESEAWKTNGAKLLLAADLLFQEVIRAAESRTHGDFDAESDLGLAAPPRQVASETKSTGTVDTARGDHDAST